MGNLLDSTAFSAFGGSTALTSTIWTVIIKEKTNIEINEMIIDLFNIHTNNEVIIFIFYTNYLVVYAKKHNKSDFL